MLCFYTKNISEDAHPFHNQFTNNIKKLRILRMQEIRIVIF